MKFFRFLGFKKKPNAPWSKYYKKGDMNLYIPDISLYDNFKRNMKKYPNNNAFDYLEVIAGPETSDEEKSKIKDIIQAYAPNAKYSISSCRTRFNR